VKKIIAGLFITLDGVVEAPERWNPPYCDEETSQAVITLGHGTVAPTFSEVSQCAS
jgi:hypothetical protein